MIQGGVLEIQFNYLCLCKEIIRLTEGTYHCERPRERICNHTFVDITTI